MTTTLRVAILFVFGSALLLAAAALFAYVAWSGSVGAATSKPVSGAPIADIPHYSQSNPLQMIAGNVVAVSADSISFTSGTLNPGGPAAMSTTTLAIDSGTQVFQQGSQKSDSQYQAEMQDFLAQIGNSHDPSIVYLAPDHYNHVPFDAANLKPGMVVQVDYIQGSTVAQSIEVMGPPSNP